MTKPRLLLASQSPRRRELMQLLGMPFEVTIAHVPETPRAEETPVELVTRLSRAKAEDAQIAGRRAGKASTRALVVACDTIVALEDGQDGARVLGKPRDAEEAAEMLRLLRGRAHLVYSAVTVVAGARRVVTELATTRLTMRRYTDSEVAAYVASGDPLDKAGAYAIQHRGFHPVSEIEGCYASVMGLPLCHLTRCLRQWGHSPPADVPTACQVHTSHRCEIYGDVLSS